MGLRECVQQEYPSMELIDVTELTELTENDFSNAAKVRRVLSQHQEIDGVLFTSVIVAGCLHALSECQESGRQIRAISTFCSPEAQQAIREGLLDAAVWCDQAETGYQAVMTLFDYLVAGQKPDCERIYIEQHISLKQSLQTD